MKKLSVKIAGAFVAVAFAVTASSASALTTQELINLLVSAGLVSADQVAALTGDSTTTSGTASASACGPFTRDLTVGSTGSDVTTLQTFLEENGYLTIPAGVAKGYFGSLTASALSSYQAANGVSPAVGYFGPITKASVATKCNPNPVVTTPGSPGSPGSTTLKGGAGSLYYTLLSKFNNEEVGEEEEDVEVLGIDVEADGSDVALKAVKIVFTQGTATNDDFDDFADEVSVWLDGEEVARVDADEFDEDNDWTDTVVINSDAIIDEDDEVELVVAVSGASNIDSNDKGDTWTADITSVRFMDAQGALISEDPGTATRTFSFEGFATASDVELRLSEGDEDINDTQLLVVDATADTDNQEVLSFMLEARGDSDIEIKSIPVSFTFNGVNVVDASTTAYLMVDGDTVATENLSAAAATETITFDDIDYVIDAGDEVEFVVVVDLQSIADGIANGDTLTVAVTDVDDIEAEDEAGDDVIDTDASGSANSDAHILSQYGVTVAQESQNFNFIGDSTSSGTFTLAFDVTAKGEKVYIDKTAGTAATNGIQYILDGATPEVSSENITSTASTEGGEWVIPAGQTKRFTLSVTVDNTSVNAAPAAGYYQVVLAGVQVDDASDNSGEVDIDVTAFDVETTSKYIADTE